MHAHDHGRSDRPRSSLTASRRSTRCRACITTTCSTRCSGAGDRIRTIHTRHEQGAAYMALGAALATGKPQAYAVVPGPGLLNPAAALLTAYGMNAPVLGADRANSAIGHRPRARPPARNPRPGRHHRAAGRFLARASARPTKPRALVAEAIRAMRDRPARPGGARMRDRRLGPARSGQPRSRRPCRPRNRRSTRTRSATPPSGSARPSDR